LSIPRFYVIPKSSQTDQMLPFLWKMYFGHYLKVIKLIDYCTIDIRAHNVFGHITPFGIRTKGPKDLPDRRDE
jgi:hypothetical protein